MTTAADDHLQPLTADDLRRIRTLLPDGVILHTAPVRDRMARIDASERQLVRNAVAKRRAEFSTGRFLAARALEELGVGAMPIGRGTMNEPLWPDGVVGSITHTSTLCMVAVADVGVVEVLGIDLETQRPEFEDVGRLILRPDEGNGSTNSGDADHDVLRRVFGAKEALYKAIHRRARRFVDFQEVRVELDEGEGCFAAVAPDDDALQALIAGGCGRFVGAESFVFALWYETA